MILCAIGGDDTHSRLLHIFENDQLPKVIKPRCFLASRIHHYEPPYVAQKLGIKTFYGQSLQQTFVEWTEEMLPYGLHYFKELRSKTGENLKSLLDVWYEERIDFSPKALGTARISHVNTGFDLLRNTQFEEKFSEVALNLYDIFDNSRYADSTELCQKYKLFPDIRLGRKNSLLETSRREKPERKTQKMVLALKETRYWGHQWTLGRKANGWSLLWRRGTNEHRWQQYPNCL